MSERSILDLVYSAHRLLAKLESSPRDYGTGDLLFSSDIHTVVEVDRQPGCNLTQLAEGLQVTKPAAFKFVKKMLALDYLVKEHPAGNMKDVAFKLSRKGRAAVRFHREFERRTFAPLMAVEAGLSPQENEAVRSFMCKLEEACSWK